MDLFIDQCCPGISMKGDNVTYHTGIGAEEGQQDDQHRACASNHKECHGVEAFAPDPPACTWRFAPDLPDARQQQQGNRNDTGDSE